MLKLIIGSNNLLVKSMAAFDQSDACCMLGKLC
ncbi:hypothetical protein WH5701_03119 [Synechococcus sp. WH 5701]|nr:hypothetical protein WH5701_03119 [Synechococcus sp. WH 5701]